MWTWLRLRKESCRIEMKKRPEVKIGNVKIGGVNPVAVQSMTDTDTADVRATVKQIIELAGAGSELVRLAVNSSSAAKAIPKIKEQLLKKGYQIPLIGDFHYNGHVLLKNHPDCAAALDKYRVNPGNVGTEESKNYNFAAVIKTALKNKKPVRIGVNSGSVDPSLLKKHPLCEAAVLSALNAAKRAEKLGMLANMIVLSVKMTDVMDVISVNRLLAAKCNYALHVGLTEAGTGDAGLISSVAALSILLNEGIGDTIRVSITPQPGQPRTKEVEICRQILQSLNLRRFAPTLIGCPGCGRTRTDLHRQMVKTVGDHIAKNSARWNKLYPGSENIKIAVMGCVVNGPGESRHADIGIHLPGKTETPVATVYIKGKPYTVIRGKNVCKEFLKIIDDYFQNHFTGKVRKSGRF